MLSLAEATETLHGGALASAVRCLLGVCAFARKTRLNKFCAPTVGCMHTCPQVHAHMQHGDPMTGAFVERQMRALATPLLDMVKQWVTEGQLTDPHEVRGTSLSVCTFCSPGLNECPPALTGVE